MKSGIILSIVYVILLALGCYLTISVIQLSETDLTPTRKEKDLLERGVIAMERLVDVEVYENIKGER